MSEVLIIGHGQFGVMGTEVKRHDLSAGEVLQKLEGLEKRTRDLYREMLKKDLEHIKQARKLAKSAARKVNTTSKG